jgi:hypothetical protein
VGAASPRRTISFLEQHWGQDLSAYDPDGPLPDIEPTDEELDPSRGTISIERTGKLERIQQWRDLAAENARSWAWSRLGCPTTKSPQPVPESGDGENPP